MIRSKFCCGGLHAEILQAHIPVTRFKHGRSTKYFTAIYKCRACNEITLRGEASLATWNTLVEIINEQKVEQLRKEKYDYDLAKAGVGTVLEPQS